MNEELIRQQSVLQQEARAVLEEVGLVTFLTRFGRPEIVGSVASGLMTWRDIDIELQKEPDEGELWQAAHFLFSTGGVRRVTLADYRSRTDSPFPKGLYIGVKYQKEEGKPWKIDLWFMPPRSPEATNYHAWMMQQINTMTDEQKLAILRIKQAISDHPQYRKKIFSIDIYKAVLEQGVTDLEAFKQYLKASGRTL